MRKVTMIVLFLLALSGVVLAQEEPTLVFEPDTVFTIRDLGFTFLFPEGWVHATGDGIQFAENETDLAAETDDDSTTQAAGYTMSLAALPLAALGLEESSDITTIADLVVTAGGLTVSEQFDQAIMTYHGVAVAGVNSNGEDGVAIIWQPGEYVIVFGLGVPEEVGLTSDVYYTFGYLIGAMQPVTDLEFTETLTIDALGGFTIDYPTDWFADWVMDEDGDEGYYIVENETDVAGISEEETVPTGRALFFQTIPLSDLGLEVGATPQDIFDLFVAAEIYPEVVVMSEHILFDVPALAGMMTPVNGTTPLIVVTGIVEDTVFAFGLKAPDEAELLEFWPSAVAMLNTIAAVEEE